MLRLMVALVLALTCTLCQAQEPPSAAERAVAYLTRAFKPNPLLPPSQQLPKTGSWAATLAPMMPFPDSCSATGHSCVEAIYRIPSLPAECRWTVLLLADPNAQPLVLNENADAARLTMRVEFPVGFFPHPVRPVSASYPPIAQAAHISDVFKIPVVVDTKGNITGKPVIEGSLVLTRAVLDAVHATAFAPLLVGDQAVVWSGTLIFAFSFNRGDAPLQLSVSSDQLKPAKH